MPNRSISTRWPAKPATPASISLGPSPWRTARHPRAYPTRRRIERAKTLLRTANLSVTEICFLVGFSSLGSFSARFRELVAASPSEYRDDAVARAGVPPIPGCMVLMWTRPHPEGQQAGRSATSAGPATVTDEPQPKENP